MVSGLAAVTIAVLGLTAVPAAAAVPAATDGVGTWHPFGNTNPITAGKATWRCGQTSEIVTGLEGQGCAIRSSGGNDVQAAMIVRNDRPASFALTGLVNLTTSQGVPIPNFEWVCSQSEIAANSWSVCFGQTIAANPGSNLRTEAFAFIGSQLLTEFMLSPPV
jgi:hypothetical protein